MTISTESSRRGLFLDTVAVDRFISKNNKIMRSPCFTFAPAKTGVGEQVSFYCVNLN